MRKRRSIDNQPSREKKVKKFVNRRKRQERLLQEVPMGRSSDGGGGDTHWGKERDNHRLLIFFKVQNSGQNTDRREEENDTHQGNQKKSRTEIAGY